MFSLPTSWPDVAVILGPIALVFARCLGLAWTAPGLGTIAIGARIRLGLAMLITLAVFPAAHLETTSTRSPQALAQLLPIELAVGALLGLSASLVIAGAKQAGELVGMQAGLSPASLLDPESSEEMNPLGHLYGLMALGVFLAIDGPLGLVGSLVESYQAIPAGGMELSQETIDGLFGRVGWALALALKAAAPAAVALIAAGLALGLLGRAAPSLSLLSYSLPIRVAVGLVIVVIGMFTLANVFMMAWAEVM